MEDINEWLIEYIDKRKEELDAGLIEASVVIPVNQAFSITQKVLPGGQVLEILRKADTIAKTECICRSKVKGCDAPTDVCIVLDDTAEEQIQDGLGQEITIEEAKKILDETPEFGLVHLCINQKRHQPKAICSYCSCCCHDLRSMLEFGNLEMILESDYIVKFDEGKCINCGNCLERCHFEAYNMEDGRVVFLAKKCYGCGLCIMSCPVDAIKLVKRI